MKLSKKELINLIREEAENFKKSFLSETIEDTIEVFEVDMNQFDDVEESDKALIYKDPSKKVERPAQPLTSVKMNAKANKLGSDSDASVAVKVNAGAAKGGNSHMTGQAKANFDSKKNIQNVKASGPFDERIEELEMNSEDKIPYDTAKTYVTAGAKKGGSSHTAGQAKADVHEVKPKKDSEEPTERIAKGIEIDGSNVELKESIKKLKDKNQNFFNKKDLQNFILNEAKTIVNKQKIKQELKTIIESAIILESFSLDQLENYVKNLSDSQTEELMEDLANFAESLGLSPEEMVDDSKVAKAIERKGLISPEDFENLNNLVQEGRVKDFVNKIKEKIKNNFFKILTGVSATSLLGSILGLAISAGAQSEAATLADYASGVEVEPNIGAIAFGIGGAISLISMIVGMHNYNKKI
jgi:hypothetical protein